MNSSNSNLSCSIHSKQIEGYCKDCQMYLCASCMFGMKNVHKSHTLISLDELAEYLRELIHQNTDLLQHEFCESRSIEVKQAKKAITDQTNNLVNRINKECEDLVKLIQQRRDFILNELQTNLQREVAKMEEQETKWNQKARIAQAINKIQIDFNDAMVYNNMQFIMQGIKNLQEPLELYEYKNITDYQYNLILNKKTKLTLEELGIMLSSLFKINQDDIIAIPYKA